MPTLAFPHRFGVTLLDEHIIFNSTMKENETSATSIMPSSFIKVFLLFVWHLLWAVGLGFRSYTYYIGAAKAVGQCRWIPREGIFWEWRLLVSVEPRGKIHFARKPWNVPLVVTPSCRHHWISTLFVSPSEKGHRQRVMDVMENANLACVFLSSRDVHPDPRSLSKTQSSRDSRNCAARRLVISTPGVLVLDHLSKWLL